MNPFPRSVLGAAFHVPAVVKQRSALGFQDVLLRLALAAEYHGTSLAVKRVLLRLQERILPQDRPVFALFLEARDAERMVWLTLDNLDLPAPAVPKKEDTRVKNPGGSTRAYAAWERGYMGYGKGLTLKDNPHRRTDKVSRSYWQMGWEAAQQEKGDGRVR